MQWCTGVAIEYRYSGTPKERHQNILSRFVLSLARDLAAVSTGGHSASVSGVYTFAFGS